MTAPTDGAPASLAAVLTQLSLDEASAEAVAPSVAAVNDLVRDWLSPLSTDPDTGAETWRDKHVYGAIMLAVRLYRRRDSPAGVLPFGMEGAAYVQRNDPDVALLLDMGAYGPMRVG